MRTLFEEARGALGGAHALRGAVRGDNPLQTSQVPFVHTDLPPSSAAREREREREYVERERVSRVGPGLRSSGERYSGDMLGDG